MMLQVGLVWPVISDEAEGLLTARVMGTSGRLVAADTKVTGGTDASVTEANGRVMVVDASVTEANDRVLVVDASVTEANGRVMVVDASVTEANDRVLVVDASVTADCLN